MFKPDIPSIIVRHQELTYPQKVFLLWCYINSSNGSTFVVTSCMNKCAARGRTIQWYADYFGIRRSEMSPMLAKLKSMNIIKTDNINTQNEYTYVDFTVFR